MGAWGYGPFDNDAADDFLAELERTNDAPADLRKVLTRRWPAVHSAVCWTRSTTSGMTCGFDRTRSTR
ncbi:DUF4259 domain-containing protein [Actinoallomurus rhizosphaericola]|uniref:DUF4259 domain-containing protein n=1 Tax=Actinoallomurus rhizosphaericola TaxID=2952536 RepID=UPI0038738693